ncbi:hypothetical protein LMG22037_04989 [Paraburkholderia phenoliruptrix]|uniref:Fis family transcriptional regulator n=1 Tax=Paraburkholderia phenoliruptrix TaxID=252970 RepID=A0A6J5C1D1_9BURK|nr:hypothetical protein [Paraburkholderia phenoliruptrix]CAB3723717.1 hypothetical protein LMG22037_04989 [Paraburkholderia phenoliruptrix]
MLLPLPAATVRAAALENHLALVAMRTGNGSVDQMSCLLKVAYLSWFLLEKPVDREQHIHLLHASETALQQCGLRAQSGQPWSLRQEEIADLESLLALHDRQLHSVCAHQYQAAWARLQHFVSSDAQSPLPARRPL